MVFVLCSLVLCITRGIIQGSGVGPTFCIVMKNDLSTLSPTNILIKYADRYWSSGGHFRNGLTDLQEIWLGDADWPSKGYGSYNFELLKIQYGGRWPSWKSKNGHTNGLTDWHEIWHGDWNWPSEGCGQLKFLTSTNPRQGRPPSWKVDKRPYLRNSLTDLQFCTKFGRRRILAFRPTVVGS